jgi:hypothetical protein
MYLSLALDLQNCNLTILAKFGWNMSLPFDFRINLLPCFSKSLVAHDFFRVFGFEQCFPCCDDIVFTSSSSYFTVSTVEYKGWNNIRAFRKDTQSFISFFVCVLNVSFMSGNGGNHFKVFPRSPCVPIAQRYPHSLAISGWSSLQISYVIKAVVGTGGQ